MSFEEESDGGGSDDIDLLVDEFEGFEQVHVGRKEPFACLFSFFSRRG